MILKSCSQSVDCVKSSRSDVIESTPMIRDEVLGSQPFEQRQCITAGQVSFAKPRLPPWRMSDWKKREIQTSSFLDEMSFHQMCSASSKSCISREEARHLISIHKIHIGSASPTVNAIAIAPMGGRSGSDLYIIELHFVTRGHGHSMAVTLLSQPLCDRRWSKQRNVCWQGVQRSEGQMISVRMCKQYCIELWKSVQRNSGRAYTWKELPKRLIEIRVREYPPLTDLD